LFKPGAEPFAKLLGWLYMFLSKADAFTNPPPICVAVIKLLDEKLRYPPFINMDVTWMKCICGVVGTGLTMEVQQFVNL